MELMIIGVKSINDQKVVRMLQKQPKKIFKKVLKAKNKPGK